MSRVEVVSSAAFARLATPLLVAREAENSMMFSMLEGARSGRLRGAGFRAVRQDDEVVAAAILPADGRLAVAVADGAPAGVVDALAAALLTGGRPVVSVLGAPRVAARLTAALEGRAAPAAKAPGLSHVAYAAAAVAPYDPPRGRGHLRRARREDEPLVATWAAAFVADVGLRDVGDAAAWARTTIERGRAYLWQTDRPVAMATHSGTSPHGARIGWVYTPPAERRLGFGAAVTAELARALLHEGSAFCCLYADAGNAATRRMYERLGFQAVGALDEWDVTAH